MVEFSRLLLFIMKQYKIFVFSILFLISGFSFSQTEDVLKINVLNPAISFEKATGSNTTLDPSLGFGYNYSYPNGNRGFFPLNPEINIGFNLN